MKDDRYIKKNLAKVYVNVCWFTSDNQLPTASQSKFQNFSTAMVERKALQTWRLPTGLSLCHSRLSPITLQFLFQVNKSQFIFSFRHNEKDSMLPSVCSAIDYR